MLVDFSRDLTMDIRTLFAQRKPSLTEGISITGRFDTPCASSEPVLAIEWSTTSKVNDLPSIEKVTLFDFSVYSPTSIQEALVPLPVSNLARYSFVTSPQLICTVSI